MKAWAGIAIAFVIGISAFWLLNRNPNVNVPQITMYSDPFPLVLGQDNTLSFAVTSSSNTPVDAELTVEAEMMMEGMLPINPRTVKSNAGLYQVPISWPMAGQWMINVSARLPNNLGTVTDTFNVYVYSTVVDNPGGPAEYRSVSQDQNVNSDPTHQLYVVIPQGTRMLMLLGQAPDVIPTEVHMNVNGLNTLVIQNNDIVDHTIGPYMVRAGETLRQTFTRAATYQGKCSANVRATIKIIVDA